MRLMAALCGLILLAIPGGPVARAQQAVSPRKKILTPAQKQYQGKWREYMAKRPALQGRAKQIFDTEMAREKAGGCPNAATTSDINVCLGKEVTKTDENLTNYAAVIRELMASAPEMPGAPAMGPTGPGLTSAESAGEFDRVEQAWRQYRDVACKAARDQVAGGTAAPSYEMQCEINLARSHMRELDSIYWLELHK
jgi:uncharacterized protein YecT (DUF1311 family)